MERKFRTALLKPKRIKVLFNWGVKPSEVIVLKNVITERKGNEKIHANLKCWFAGPFREKLDVDALSERIQRTLINEKSPFWICGVIDAIIILEGSKRVIDEVLDFRKKYNYDIAYFDKILDRSLDPWLAKFGVKRREITTDV